MAQQVGDDFVVNVDALIAVGIDPATLRTAVNQAEQFGKNFGSSIAGAANKSFGSMAEDLTKALTGAKTKGERDRAIREISRQYENLAREVLAAAQQVGRSVGGMDEGLGRTASQARATSAAVGGVGDAFDQAAASARRMAAGTDNTFDRSATDADAFAASIRKINAAVDGMEQNFASLSNIIAASLGKARTEFAVIEQTAQQFRGIAKQQERLAAQASKDQARTALQEQRALDRQREQERAASLRSSLTQQKSALAQENAAFNASLQSNLVAEKGFQQRRTALVQSGLLATRSLYQSLSSGVSTVISGAYSAMVAATRRGEDQITAASRQGLQERKVQQERFIQQSVADVRRQQGAVAAAQTQLDNGGVLGALTGQSRAGAAIRGAAIGGGIISALGIKQAVDFESAMADVSKTVDGTAEVMASLRQGIIDLAKEIPSTREEIAAVATVAGQLGIEAPNILDFSKVMIDLGNSTNVAAEEAADLLAKFATVTQMNQGEFDRLGSTIVALGNNFAGTEKDIIAMAQRLSSAGALAGLTQPEIVGIANALVTVGIEAEAGGTAFSRAIGDIAKAVGTGTEAVAPFAQVAGRTAESFQELFKSNPAAAISEFVVGLGAVKDEGGNLFQVLDDIGFKEIRLSNAFRSLAGSGDLFTRSLSTATTAWEENSALVTEATIRYQTAASRFKITKNVLSDVSRQLGEIIVPILVGITSTLEPVLGLVSDALGLLTRNLSTLGKVAEPALEVVRKALAGIVVTLTAIIAVKGGVEVIKLLGLALSSLASPIGVTIVALTAIGGAIGFVLAQSEPLREALGRLFDRLKTGASDATAGPLDKIAEIFQKVRERVERAAEVVGFFITLLIDSDIRKRFIEWQELDPNAEKEGLLGFFLNLIDAVPKVIKAIIDGFREAVGFIRRVATDPAFETFRKAVLGAAAGVGALVVAIKGINAAKAAFAGLRVAATAVAGFASPFGIAAIALGALVAGFVTLYRKSEPFRRLVDDLVDSIKTVVSTILRAAAPALKTFAEVVEKSAGRAFEILSEALSDFVDYLNSPAFAGALARIGEIIGGIIEVIASGFATVVDFIQNTAAAIGKLGVFEGLRQAAVTAFEGIAGLVGDIFSAIGSTIAGFFEGVDWASVAQSAAVGIFNFFRAIGDAVGRFIGSKEFIRTVVVAVGVVAGALGSAAGGLITGLVEGLRDSDAGQKLKEYFEEALEAASDAIREYGPQVVQEIKNVLTEGLETALATLFPPALLARTINDPFNSALSVLALTVEALFIGKVVKLFVSGFGTIANTIRGLALAPRILTGGLSAVADDVASATKKVDTNKRTLDQISNTYGALPARAAQAAGAVQRIGEAGKRADDGTSNLTASLKSLGDTLRGGEAQVRGGIGLLDATKTSSEKAGAAINIVKDNFLAMAGAFAGGAMAGAGIGTAIVADDPLGKIAGITGAITGIGTVATLTASVVASAGLTAGLLTGGVGLAITAITAGIVLLQNKNKEVLAQAQATKELRKSYGDFFASVVGEVGGNRRAASLKLLDELQDKGGETFKKLTDAAELYEVSLGTITAAITGGTKEYENLLRVTDAAFSDADRRLGELREQRREILDDNTLGRGLRRDALAANDKEIADQEKIVEKLRLAGVAIDEVRNSYALAREESVQHKAIVEALAEIEKERQTVVQKNLDLAREEKRVQDQIASVIRDIIDLEKGQARARNERELRQASRELARRFLPTEGNAPELVFDSANAEQADATAEAIDQMTANMDLFVASIAQSVTTTGQFGDRLNDVQTALTEVYRSQGLNTETAARLAAEVVAPFRDGAIFAQAFFARIEEDLDSLEIRLGELPDTINLKAIVETVEFLPAQKALEQFIEAPSQVTLQPLLDMGIPTDVIEAFIKDPREATIQPIVDEVTQRIAEGTLGTFATDVVAPIMPEVDPEAQTAAEKAINDATRPRTVLYVLEEGKKVTNPLSGGLFGDLPDVIIPKNPTGIFPKPSASSQSVPGRGLPQPADLTASDWLTEFGAEIFKLRTELQEPWVATVVADVDDGPAKDALQAFIEAPNAKNIEALFDLGIPQTVLEAFIKDPSEKTIQPIIAALTGADQQQLDAIVAPANKPIVPVLDPAALARVRQQLQAGIGTGVFNIATQELALNRDLNGNGIIGSKYGRIITEPTLSWLGEEGRKEVVIPLTMPNRAAQLYEQSGLANVLAKAGVMAPGTAPAVQRVVATTGGGGPSRQEFDRVVGVLESLRGDLREDMDTRRDNVFLMEGVEKPYPTARETASKLRRKRRRR